MSKELPNWMREGRDTLQSRPPQGSRVQSQSYISSPGVHPAPHAHTGAAVPGTHRNVVIGITILAWLAMLSTFFWAGWMFTIAVSPPRIDFLTGDADSYWGFGRVMVSLVIAIIGSIVTWEAVDRLVE